MLGDERNGRRVPQASLVTSFALQSRTMSALAIRFIITRYGRENIGFLWVILEPMILCIGVMIAWSILKGGYEHGIQIIAIVFTGYMPLTLQRHISGSGIYILRATKSTLIHRNITYYDSFITRMLLEFISTTAAATVIYVTLVLCGIFTPAYDIGLLLTGWLLMGFISIGIGCIYAGISESFEFIEKFLPAFNYLLVPFSGCFFMVEWLPYGAQEIVLYVPLIHAFETVRAGMFGPSVVTHYSLMYGFGTSIVLTCAGIILINSVRDRVK